LMLNERLRRLQLSLRHDKRHPALSRVTDIPAILTKRLERHQQLICGRRIPVRAILPPLQLRQQNPNVLTTCHASPSASTTPPANEPATLPLTTTRSERPPPQVRAQSPAPWTTKPWPPRSDPNPSHRPPQSDASCPTQTGCAQDHPTPSTPSA